MASLRLPSTILGFALTLTSFVSLRLALACSAPPGGCTYCEKLSATLPDTKFQSYSLGARPWAWPIAYNQGQWNTYYSSQAASDNVRGGPSINFELFREMGTLLKVGSATTLSGCCSECANTTGCILYHYFPYVNKAKTATVMQGFVAGKKCYLITGGLDKTGNQTVLPGGAPWSGTHNQQIGVANSYDTNPASQFYIPQVFQAYGTSSWWFSNVDYSIVGGQCNSSPGAHDDPHFTGAKGTRFEFNGAADQSFCLVTDERLHINAVLGGYQDRRNLNGSSQPTLRTWITELGVAFKAADGATHTLHLAARKGKELRRTAASFLARVEVDGKAVAVPTSVGAEVQTPEGLSFRLTAQASKGPFDVDTYRLTVGELAQATIQMRVAHALLRQPQEAYAHFNVQFEQLQATPNVHGVLGQTYRNTPQQIKKAMNLQMLNNLLHAPVHVDSKEGEGFLDGTVADYRTSGPLASDCAFTSFSA